MGIFHLGILISFVSLNTNQRKNCLDAWGIFVAYSFVFNIQLEERKCNFKYFAKTICLQHPKLKCLPMLHVFNAYIFCMYVFNVLKKICYSWVSFCRLCSFCIILSLTFLFCWLPMFVFHHFKMCCIFHVTPPPSPLHLPFNQSCACVSYDSYVMCSCMVMMMSSSLANRR